MRSLLRSNRGFTLVETIVVLMLITVIVLAGYFIFDAGYRSYQTTSRQVSAQENFRLATDYFRKELGTAKSITPFDSDVTSPAISTSKQAIIFSENVSGKQNAVYVKTQLGEEMVGYPVDDLIVTFQKASGTDGEKIIFAYFQADGVDQFKVSILLENINLGSEVDTAPYDSILYEMY